MTERKYNKIIKLLNDRDKVIEYNERLEKENEELKNQEKILLDRILTLQKTNGSLTDKVEKMKCCGNCFKFNTDKRCGSNVGYEFCDKWELSE